MILHGTLGTRELFPMGAQWHIGRRLVSPSTKYQQDTTANCVKCVKCVMCPGITRARGFSAVFRECATAK